MKIYSSFDEYLQDNPTCDVPKVIQVSYAEHLRHWQEIVDGAMLNAKNVRKSINVQLQSKVANKHDFDILNHKVNSLLRCVEDIQNAVKWYETQLQSGDVAQPKGAVETKHHAKFLANAENYWKSLISECRAYQAKLEPIKEAIGFQNWVHDTHPLTRR